MRRQTSELVWTRAIQDALVGALTVVPGGALLLNLRVRLLTSDVIPGGQVVWGDLAEATFDGYGAVTPVAFAGPVTTANGARADVSQALYEAGDAIVAPGQAVTGYALTNNAMPPVLYGGELFAEPVQFAVPGDFLTLDVFLPVQLGQATGQDQ